MDIQKTKKKISSSDIFNCKNPADFINSIVFDLGISSYSPSKFYICEVQGIFFLTKLSFYKKTSHEIYDVDNSQYMSQVDAEIKILKLLDKNIIDKNISPCVLELIHSQTCSNIKDLIKTTISDCNKPSATTRGISAAVYGEFCYYSELMAAGFAHDRFSFLVLERCDITLFEFIKKTAGNPINFSIFKSILFQVFFTMHAIIKVYPSFHHGDLHVENIMLRFDKLYEFSARDVKFLVFHVDETPYYIPYYGIIAKIIDFGFSTIKEEGITSDIFGEREYAAMRIHNDVHNLLQTISTAVQSFNDSLYQWVDKTFTKLDPSKSYTYQSVEFLRTIEKKIPSFHDLVTSDVFSEYREAAKPNKNSIYHEYAKKY